MQVGYHGYSRACVCIVSRRTGADTEEDWCRDRFSSVFVPFQAKILEIISCEETCSVTFEQIVAE